MAVPTTDVLRMKQGTLLPVAAGQLLLDGEPYEVAVATIVFRMRPAGSTGEPTIEAAATFTDAIEGEWEYVWQAGDTDVPGTYDLELEVTFTGNGKKVVFPNEGYATVIIEPTLEES